MNTLRQAVFGLVICVCCSSSSFALQDEVIYTVRGTVGGFGDVDVPLNGESFVAEFVVNTLTPDTDSASDRGSYPGAIVSSSINFSGGFTSGVDFAGGSIVITPGGAVGILDQNDLGSILIENQDT